jgi:hypothetical protein
LRKLLVRAARGFASCVLGGSAFGALAAAEIFYGILVDHSSPPHDAGLSGLDVGYPPNVTARI